MTLRLVGMKLGLIVPLSVISFGVAAYLWDPVPLQILRNAIFDQFQRWQPRAYQESPVRIIDIDDESLRRLGQWPWPRTRVAELLGKLQEAGAAAIAFDVIFAEPDRTSPTPMLDLWQAPAAVRRQVEKLPDHDEVLRQTIGRGSVVVGFAVDRGSAHAVVPEVKARYVIAGAAPQSHVHDFSSATLSLPQLQAAAAGNGALTFIPDADGVVRKVPLLVRMGGVLLPSLSAEALRVAQGARNYTVRAVPDKGVGLAEVRIGGLVIPTTAQGEVLINYTKPVASRYIPAWKVFANEVPAEQLAGHILLIGTSAQGLMDLRFSPLGGAIPGVEVHAQVVEQILTGVGLNRPSWAGAIEALVIVCGGLLVGVIALSTGAMFSFFIVAATLALLWAGAWQAFVQGGLLLDPVIPSLALITTYMFSSIVRHLSSERRQRWVKQAFSRYISPNLVTYLIEHPDALELGGRRQQCSFVFTDLAGFTTLMEGMDPGAAVSLLNDYLDGMIEIAFSHQGTLDRIVGDAVAILFSAPVPQPDHQRRALACALDMQRFSSRYVKQLEARGIGFGQTRIGIHSGEVIVGNFGGKTIFDYRALGDPVNTASRLEGANKHLGTAACVSEATLSGCPDWPARPIGRIVLKGKARALAVFQPLDPQLHQVRDAEYQDAFDLLRTVHPDAIHAFEKLAGRRPDDPLVALHLKRLQGGETGDLILMSEK